MTALGPDLLMRRSAVISPCDKYRYWLARDWSDTPPLVFVMLNPSKADADIDDPTIGRCISFARREGAGGIVVCNLFALRSKDPSALIAGGVSAWGPDNFLYLGDALTGPRRIICAWGAEPIARDKGLVFRAQAKQVGKPLMCLGKTKDGSPRHPLYLPASQPLEAYP